MTWDQISAVAQIVGVVAGIASVIFLILEIRRNSKAIEGSTVQALMAMEQSLFTYLADHSDLYVRGCADFAALSNSESFSFNRYVGAYMSLYYAAFKQVEQGLIDAEVWVAYQNSMRTNLGRPGFAACWASFAAHYPASFQAETRRL